MILLFFNNEIFNKSKSMRIDPFVNNHIPPFNDDEYSYINPDMDYYRDFSGLKGTMYRELNPLTKEDSILTTPPKKNNNFNSIVNKLELYPESFYTLF
jgi:hypothetical protein